jgi:hypothetical protein
MTKECAEQANVRVEIGKNLHSLLAPGAETVEGPAPCDHAALAPQR